MVNEMTKYAFILLAGDQEAFLKRLQALGVVDVTRSMKPVDDRSQAMLARITDIRRAVALLEAAEGAPAGPVASDDPIGETFKAHDLLAELRGRRAAEERERKAREAWGGFDSKALRQLAGQGLTVRFYCVPRKKFDPAWAEQVPLQVVSDAGASVYFVTVSDDPAYTFPVAETAAPQASAAEAAAEVAHIDVRIRETQERLAALKACLPQLRAEQAALAADLDRYLAGEGASKAAEDRIAVFEGFAPVEEDARLAQAFDAMDVYWLRDRASAADNPPIQLKNNRFTAMFAPLTDMYGRPVYDEFDPTPYISVFFLLFFAMCMGDAGYGLVLILAGLFMKRVPSFAKTAPLIVTLGIGTVIIGLLFHTFFSIDIAGWDRIPGWLRKVFLPSRIAGYDGTMVLALIVGIVHLCLAMVVKAVYATRRQGFPNTLGTWGWTLLIVGGAIVAGISLIGVLDKTLTRWIVIGLGSLSAIGIFLLNDIHRSPLKNIGSGLWETYNMATGLLGDVLSYLRLYALGLAGAMLGFAFNDLGRMVLGDEPGVASWIGFLLIVIIGHTLNFAMAALGAFVHPLRLNFLEFFKNSGYEGTGRAYAPLKKNN